MAELQDETARRDKVEKQVSSSVFLRYRLIMALTYILSLIIAVSLFIWLYSMHLGTTLEKTEIDVRNHKVTLDDIVQASVNFVSGMQLFANDFLNKAEQRGGDAPLDNGDPLFERLMQSPKDGFLTLDNPPAPYARKEIGNLTAVWPPKKESPERLQQEMQMALGLNPLFRIIKNAIPNSAWVYYTSQAEFINIFPHTDSSAFRFTPELYTHGFYYRGLPEANPERKIFWTEAYMDEAGQGLMVSLAAPVYQGETFKGTVALDLTLQELNRHIDQLNFGLGFAFIVNDMEQLLAHPELVSTEQTAVGSGKTALPGDIRDRYQDIISADYSKGVRTFGDYYTYVASLEEVPWKLVYVVPKSEITGEILIAALPQGAFLLISLTAMLLISNWLTNKDFIGPSRKLVGFIADRSKGLGVEPPHVPAGWQPWLDNVGEAFTSHSEMVALNHELDTARTIQASALPTLFPDTEKVSVYGFMRAAKSVGGDFYDVIEFDDGRVGIVIADVSGKGVPASLFMMVARTILRTVATTDASPGSCLTIVNDQLAENNDGGMFVTLFYGVLDPESGELIYANGGHNLPVLVNANGSVAFLEGTDGVALGVMDDMEFEEGRTVLRPGDSLFLYTDGITEANNPAMTLYEEKRLEAVLQGKAGLTPMAMCQMVVADVDAFAEDEPQADDMTCLVLHCKPEQERA